jgi:glutamyl-Q tRNA(Asp) synthetase
LHFGLNWDGAIIFQSKQTDIYFEALERLLDDDLVYRCVCTRKSLAHYRQQHPDKEHLYPGFCRNLLTNSRSLHALRIKTGDQVIRFDDAIQGEIVQSMAKQHGDFIVLRRDNIITYHLAAAVDDRRERISEVARGNDLLGSTPKQLYLQQLLGYPSPRYMHIPIVVDEQGQKLSKQSYAEAVDRFNPKELLFTALMLLQQQPPKELYGVPVDELLSWGITHWNSEKLKYCREVRLPRLGIINN